MDVDLRKINQLWRLFATAFGFFTFGVGGLFLTLVFFPLVHLFVSDVERRKAVAQSTIRQAFRFFIAEIKWLRVIDVKIEGRELLEQDRGCVLVANHPTLIDYVLITSLLPQCDCIVKEALWHNPFVRGAITAAGYVDNSDTAEMLSKCDTLLKKGRVLLVFPEGTRTIPGEKLQLKRGAAQIAVRSRCDLRVIHIHCAPSFLNKGKKWHQLPVVKPFFLVQVMEKVNIRNFADESTADSVAARKLTEYLSKALTLETC